MCPAEQSHAPDPMHQPGLLPVDSVEERFLMDAGSYDEVTGESEVSSCRPVSVLLMCLLSVCQDTSAALQLQGRAMRSPRRCIPHQQSCLGYPLPCCDPCDTCYCRFFNAICYCRRVGHTCPSRRTWIHLTGKHSFSVLFHVLCNKLYFMMFSVVYSNILLMDNKWIKNRYKCTNMLSCRCVRGNDSTTLMCREKKFLYYLFGGFIVLDTMS